MDIISGIAGFEGRARVLSKEEVDRAFNLYFTR
jgi:hypothetical protein